MQLFAGTSDYFIPKAINNEIAPQLTDAFRRQFGYSVSDSEARAWNNSLRDLAYCMRDAAVPETGIVVEYRLPMSSKRLDAMITGIGSDSRERAVIVELKQWERAGTSGIEDCVLLGPQLHLHPSRQAGAYAEYLQGMHTAFYNDSGAGFVDLAACSFLHNAHSQTCGGLLAPRYAATLTQYPLFTGDMRGAFQEFLADRTGHGDGREVLQKVLQSRLVPSKRLLDHVAEMIEGNRVFDLIDEQLVAFNIVMSEIEKLSVKSGRAAVLVTGGPGTGKSVIAVRLLAALAKRGRTVYHCTGSKAFTTNLRARVGNRASALLKYFNGFVSAEPGAIDVLIADEAHRIRETSNDRFRRASTKPQVEELLDAAKVSVFLLDDHQVVRPGEVGTPQMIRDAAKRKGTDLFELALVGQFRCSGSESYMNWIDHVFGLGGERDLGWRGDYEFAICDSPADLERRIRGRFTEGYSARMVAGFCWPWTEPLPDNSLEDDVVIGNWRRPWNRKEKGSEPPHRHPYTIWATQDEGLDQVGCIYSAQGFEFDYCGVIIGNDLIWDSGSRAWKGMAANSQDKVVRRSADLTRNLCNTYRVLLTRGMRGTYVYFLDRTTREHFERLLASGKES